MRSSHRLATVPDMATCPGALIGHTDNTVMACTEDEEPDGCRNGDLRHDGDAITARTAYLVKTIRPARRRDNVRTSIRQRRGCGVTVLSCER
jgi:hypothetical protein